MSEETWSGTSLRLAALERKIESLEREIALLRNGSLAASEGLGKSTVATASEKPIANEQSLDTLLRSLGRRLDSGKPNPSYFNVRFRAYEVALMNIRAVGYALGKLEARRVLGRDAPSAPPKINLKSKLCTKKDIDSDWALFWSKEIRREPIYHRKLWEFVYIAQALFISGKLAPGNLGVGFGCGKEPLPSLFAKYGANVVGTDLAETDPKSKAWANSNQHVNNVALIRDATICPDQVKLENILFESVDMNNIPDTLFGRFDFCWSACALEHLGSIEAGFDFIRNSLRTLKPGGVAVHTTEYTFDPEPAHEKWPTVLFKKEQIVPFVDDLRSKGYSVADLDFSEGDDPLDYFADLQMKELYTKRLKADLHLKTIFDGFACTSFGLIIQTPQLDKS